MKRIVLGAALALLLASTAGWAQSVDLRADSVTVSPAVQGQNYLVTLHFTNLGPAVFSSRTRITVDIDDPTKPGWPGGVRMASACQDSVSEEIDIPVSVPVSGSASATLTHAFGPCNMAAIRVTGTVEVAEPGYSDPNAGNNTVQDDITLLAVVPAVNGSAVAALALLCGAAAWFARRRRGAARLG